MSITARAFRSFDGEQVVSAIRDAFEYNPATGSLVWKPRSENPNTTAQERGAITFFNRTYAGKDVGGSDMRCLRFYGRAFPRTHVIWAVIHGRKPSGLIDHIDGDPLNNRLSNLREVCCAENSRNMAIFRTNKSGVCGVYFDKARGRWVAAISDKCRKIQLGYYEDFDEAVEARKRAERRLNYHANHGRTSQVRA